MATVISSPGQPTRQEQRAEVPIVRAAPADREEIDRLVALAHERDRDQAERAAAAEPAPATAPPPAPPPPPVKSKPRKKGARR